MINLSVVIPTYNEEQNIRECLASAKFADEIVMVDGGSCDRTLEIAKEFGIQPIIVPPPKRGWETQRIEGIDKAQGQWILCLDADERATPALAEEIQTIIKNSASVNGYKIPFRQFFFNREMRFGGLGNACLLRLFRKGRARYLHGGQIHEQLFVDGSVSVCKHPILHYGTRDLTQYFKKFNLYTSLTAKKLFGQGKRVTLLNALVCFMMKPLYYFLLRYIVRKGFLDGFYGFVIALLSSFTVIVNYVKLWELQQGKE